ncbi:MAG: hypothetical protein KDA91_21520 [Planctomycetaceae bacterium]|nr:hypothetical protein [Planctomycetaceae bacterium]
MGSTSTGDVNADKRITLATILLCLVFSASSIALAESPLVELPVKVTRTPQLGLRPSESSTFVYRSIDMPLRSSKVRKYMASATLWDGRFGLVRTSDASTELYELTNEDGTSWNTGAIDIARNSPSGKFIALFEEDLRICVIDVENEVLAATEYFAPRIWSPSKDTALRGLNAVFSYWLSDPDRLLLQFCDGCFLSIDAEKHTVTRLRDSEWNWQLPANSGVVLDSTLGHNLRYIAEKCEEKHISIKTCANEFTLTDRRFLMHQILMQQIVEQSLNLETSDRTPNSSIVRPEISEAGDVFQISDGRALIRCGRETYRDTISREATGDSTLYLIWRVAGRSRDGTVWMKKYYGPIPNMNSDVVCVKSSGDCTQIAERDRVTGQLRVTTLPDESSNKADVRLFQMPAINSDCFSLQFASDREAIEVVFESPANRIEVTQIDINM